ncbi:MAG: hypothetical protein Ct9H90mP22_6880 [Gammaproteobacteria bacterium]|nr:MAG: hypothetical protein Ct9H90mP22_6880 [Gammaproteobacteria bacterium]
MKNIEDISRDEEIIVLPGEVIPLDGIFSLDINFDESIITGDQYQ